MMEREIQELRTTSVSSSKDIYFLDVSRHFINAIEWRETFILGLILFHLCVYVAIVITRWRPLLQKTFFFIIVIIVALCERLNSWCHNHWSLLATQNYFDKRGVFMSIMVAAPLLLAGTIILIRILFEASTLVVRVKQNELKRYLQTQKNGQKGEIGIDEDSCDDSTRSIKDKTRESEKSQEEIIANKKTQ